MTTSPVTPTGAGRPGFTTVELLVALVVSLTLIGGAIALLGTLQRGAARQYATGETRNQLHRSVDQLVRVVRNAHDLDPTSTEASLRIIGGFTESLCGNESCWIELDQETRRLIARPPGQGGESGHSTELVDGVESVTFTYGFFETGDQVIPTPFSPTASAGDPDHLTAVRVDLALDTSPTRTRRTGELRVHAVLRTKVLALLSTS